MCWNIICAGIFCTRGMPGIPNVLEYVRNILTQGMPGIPLA